MVKLRSEAWLLRGISSIPGELTLVAGRLSFTAHNTGSAWPWQLRKLGRVLDAPFIAKTIDEGIRTVDFNWPASELEVWCPWYLFGGGIKLRRGPLVLRFSFGKPANMQTRAGRHEPAGAATEVAATLDEVRDMRALGAIWQAALARA